MDTSKIKLFNPFDLYHTYGLPLDISLALLENKGLTPDWPAFWEDSIREGWNPTSTFNKIVYACREAFGLEHSLEVEKRLKLYIMNLSDSDTEDGFGLKHGRVHKELSGARAARTYRDKCEDSKNDSSDIG